jgi:hypothetical protein
VGNLKVRTQRLDHLSLIAGLCNRIGLISLIDRLIPSKRRVSVGQAVQALILNGLGFTGRALYLGPEFFDNKPLDVLIGGGLSADELNADTLARALDDIYYYPTFSILRTVLGARRWVWVACCAAATVFKVQDRRNTACAKILLAQGCEERVVVTDRLGSYNWIPDEDRQHCWAHLKRDFKAIEDSADATAQRIGAQLGAQTKLLFEHWHAHKAGRVTRQGFEQKVEQEIKPQVRALLAQGLMCEHSKTEGTCEEMLKGWECLWTFVRRPGVEPTNNEAERAIRGAVTWRKHSGGTQTDEGAQFVERMLSCVSTLKRKGASVLAYLTALMSALAARRPSPSFLNSS